MTQNLEIGVFSITQWVYFTYNYPSPEPFFDNVFGHLGRHLYNKWESYNNDWNRLFVELDRENQQKLAAWIVANYHGVDSRRPQALKTTL